MACRTPPDGASAASVHCPKGAGRGREGDGGFHLKVIEAEPMAEVLTLLLIRASNVKR
jgi:hypothetical protein